MPRKLRLKDPNPGATRLLLTTMSAALAADPPTPALPSNGAMVPTATVSGQLAAFAQVYKTVDDTERAYLLALDARRAIEGDALGLLSDTTLGLKAFFGASSPALKPYAVTPEKIAAPLTTPQQTVANEKNAATRGVRGTTGSKAKKALHGTVPAAPAPATPAAATTTPGAGAAGTSTP